MKKEKRKKSENIQRIWMDYLSRNPSSSPNTTVIIYRHRFAYETTLHPVK